jgi:predicted DNA-binding transcriptional regulator AlpA
MALRHWAPEETANALKSGALPELIGRDAVCALTGWTRAMLEVRSRTGMFPAPVVLSKNRALRWKTELVAKWLKDHGIIEPPKPVSWRGPQPWQRKPKVRPRAGGRAANQNR